MMAFYIFIALFLIAVILWVTNFMCDALFNRSLKRFFISPISEKEFKHLLSLIQKQKVLKKELSSYKIGAYLIKDESWSSLSWTVNGVRLSIWQELRLKKTIERKLLRTELLSKAGDLLYKDGE